MPFFQAPPELANQYTADRALRAVLAQALPPDVLRDIEPQLENMGELAGGELYRMQLADRRNEPVLTQWDPWGRRVDRIEVSPLWHAAGRLAAERGLIALAYEQPYAEHSRLCQFALAYLFLPSTDLYGCPLAMTDGAARVLVSSRNQNLIARALPHLTTRDPAQFWTSGQWMTETSGGSDVSQTATVARRHGDHWRLQGRKWFTSAVTSQMALTLARPEGNPAGGQGLALFYVETRDADGMPNNIRVQRLKDKMGTRKVPTAELQLDDTPAELVMGTTDGVRNIAPLLSITRVWNSVTAISYMRRGLALARDYARRRKAFGAELAKLPLHVDTLASLEAEFLGALHLTFFVVALLGRSEAGRASERQLQLLRLLTPVVKLVTAKQAVTVLSEVIESFGGAGYVEDTGLPVLLRDAHVLPIWEGTTNVLSLDVSSVLKAGAGVPLFQREAGILLRNVRDASLLRISALVEQALEAAAAWLQTMETKPGQREAGARRLALTLGRAFELALLTNHAQWALDNQQGSYQGAAARRFAAAGVNLLAAIDPRDSEILLTD